MREEVGGEEEGVRAGGERKREGRWPVMCGVETDVVS